jgi:hypothetical protein
MRSCRRIVGLIGACVSGFCQTNIYHQTPNTHTVLLGTETTADYLLTLDRRAIVRRDASSHEAILRLPATYRDGVLEVLGILNHSDTVEAFLGWVDVQSDVGEFEHHIQIFRGTLGTAIRYSLQFRNL